MFEIHYGPRGQFRLVTGDAQGEWANYRGIATLEHEGQVYFAVTRYYDGLPGVKPNRVYRAIVAGTEVKEAGEFARGDRVYFADHGPDDQGTVTDAVHGANGRWMYNVRWDDGSEFDLYDAGQLGRA